MLRKTILLAATASCGFSNFAYSHDAWLRPSITVLSDTNQSVTVDAGTSTTPFQPDHNAMNIESVKIWAPDGAMGKVENPARGRYRSTFDVRIDKPGTWRVGVENTSFTGTFKVNGEDWAVGRRRNGGPGSGAGGAGAMPTDTHGPQASGTSSTAGQTRALGSLPPQGGEGGQRRPMIDPGHIVATINDIPAEATDISLTESYSRNEFFVTAGPPTDSLFRPANKGLEFIPVTPPTDLVTDEPGKFRFLLDGKPASGIKVRIIPGGQRFREDEHAQELFTDADGTITVKWPVAGFYWLNASVTDDKPNNAKASKRRMSYTATLEVVAP
jgi:uncharacterized GH25 family protein